MSERYILDRNNNPIPCEDLMEWGKWMQSGNRHVGLTYLVKDGHEIRVSTVFLGLDHSFGIGQKPLIYETMIFGGDNDSYQERYSTRDEAIKGHEVAVNLVKDEINGIR